MAAALLTPEPVTLSNMPNLADTRFLSQLLATLGVEVYWPKGDSTCRLNAEELTSTIDQLTQAIATLQCARCIATRLVLG